MLRPCDLLRGAREKAKPKRSQADLAAELGVTQPCISKIESGESIPRPGDAKRYAEAYGVNHKKLLDAVLAALEERARANAKAKAS